MIISNSILLVERQCYECKSNTTGIPGWYRNNDAQGTWLCNKCRMKKWRRANGIFQDFKNNLAMRTCSSCRSADTLLSYNRFGYPYKRWTNDGQGGWLCNRCYNRIVYRPKSHNHILFKHKTIYLQSNPRDGICSQCGKTGITHIHHTEYHDDDPLRDTIELCRSCHAYETWKQRRKGKEDD
jgi:hypothetical protein